MLAASEEKKWNAETRLVSDYEQEEEEEEEDESSRDTI